MSIPLSNIVELLNCLGIFDDMRQVETHYSVLSKRDIKAIKCKTKEHKKCVQQIMVISYLSMFFEY